MRLLIGQPTAGDVVTGTVGYMMGLARALDRRGIAWDYRGLSIADIALARNVLASNIVADARYTHLLFIDSDMGFEPATVLGLLDLDKPVVAAACPKRFVAWDRLRRVAEAGRDMGGTDGERTQRMLDESLSYNVEMAHADGRRHVPRREGRFMTVAAIGTALMAIRRDAFSTLLERGICRTRTGYSSPSLPEDAVLCDFFSTQESPDGTLVESEDISFCRRWVDQASGEIWADVESRVMHYGMRGHSGRYLGQARREHPDLWVTE